LIHDPDLVRRSLDALLFALRNRAQYAAVKRIAGDQRATARALSLSRDVARSLSPRVSDHGYSIEDAMREVWNRDGSCVEQPRTLRVAGFSWELHEKFQARDITTVTTRFGSLLRSRPPVPLAVDGNHGFYPRRLNRGAF